MSDESVHFQSFEQFWPFYVRQHSHPVCRAFHFTGTSLAIAFLFMAAWDGVRWLAAVPVAGYLFAWIGHFAFERNRPATFTYPLWSLRGDLRMYARTWTGRMGDELRRAGVGG